LLTEGIGWLAGIAALVLQYEARPPRPQDIERILALERELDLTTTQLLYATCALHRPAPTAVQ
jgi:hypothetical protein